MNILPQDKELAEKLVDFGAFCLSQARLEWLRDQLDGAEKWAEEFLETLREVKKD